MIENENLVTEVAENVEHTTEETPTKTYTQEEVNAIVGKRIARNEAKIRKEYDRKYGELESVLKAGTGKESIEEMTDTFSQFYQSKGIEMPKRPVYTAKDIEVLARAEAEEIIRSGNDEVFEEVDRLAKIGADKMTAREKATFKILAEHRQNAERIEELSKIGVTEDVYNSQEFQNFAKKFRTDVPITDIYEDFAKMNPKKEYKTIGSMKNTSPKDSGVKDYYTRDEALRFTRQDFDKNPALYKAVQASMLKW